MRCHVQNQLLTYTSNCKQCGRSMDVDCVSSSLINIILRVIVIYLQLFITKNQIFCCSGIPTMSHITLSIGKMNGTLLPSI